MLSAQGYREQIEKQLRELGVDEADRVLVLSTVNGYGLARYIDGADPGGEEVAAGVKRARAEADARWIALNHARADLHAAVADLRRDYPDAWAQVELRLEPALELADQAVAAWNQAVLAAERLEDGVSS